VPTPPCWAAGLTQGSQRENAEPVDRWVEAYAGHAAAAVALVRRAAALFAAFAAAGCLA